MRAKVEAGRNMQRKCDEERLLRWEERLDGPERKQEKDRKGWG